MTIAYTPEQRAQMAYEGACSFVERALTTAQMIAGAAQRGETRVVEQYLRSLESLGAEMRRWWQPEDEALPDRPS